MMSATVFEANAGSELTENARLHLPLAHPYTRYGLAVALVQSRLRPDAVNEASLREALAHSIELGLGNFRMRTGDNPNTTRLLRFEPVKFEDLLADASLVQSSGLASKGIYIFPTVVTTDGNAKDTWKNAVEVLKKLRDGNSFEDREKFKRSFAPTTAKINNGIGSQTEQPGSLLEVACALITTLTPLKPAAWPGQNTVIIPDLQLKEMYDFIELFERMQGTEVRGDLMQAQLKEIKPATGDKPQRAARKSAKEVAPKSEYRRPRLHSGNYPHAPRDTGTLGAVGLLGAIGRWAHAANETPWAERVLSSIAGGTKGSGGRPLYIVSYDKISQVRFGHHVVGLALSGHLAEIVDALWRDTRLYADIDSPMIRHETPAYQLFYLQTSRFLQSFTPPAFADFLASRADYPPELRPLFEEYFKNMDKEIVLSAGALGQWLNRTAYFVAEGEVEAGASERRGKVAKAKAKILIEFESAAMSAKSPEDLLFRLSTRCGRLLQDDAPADAKRFMDATASREINQDQATQLLIAYMRLRAPRAQTGESESTPAMAVADGATAPSTMPTE